jgi:predicted tellurium resistance membrane protein TerC
MDFAKLVDWVDRPDAWVALLTLTVLEIVLGIDNIIFIAILASKLPKEQQNKARVQGLAAALITRLMLLFSLAYISRLTKPLFTIALPIGELRQSVSGRDLILFLGGLFLIAKATMEIHEKLEGAEGGRTARGAKNFISVIIQIMLIDIVFSLDSVITAVGMSGDLGVMALAVIIAVIMMMFASKPIAEFVERHPTVKMLALAFLVMIGVALVAEGFGREIPKGYIYTAMAFSVLVEMLNIRIRKQAAEPVRFKERLAADDVAGVPDPDDIRDHEARLRAERAARDAPS